MKYTVYKLSLKHNSNFFSIQVKWWGKNIFMTRFISTQAGYSDWSVTTLFLSVEKVAF